MNIPGTAETPELWERAQETAERLLNELKEAVQVEQRDIGVLRQELKITVPEKVIADHLDHNYAELKQDAIVPGFRKGRAPRRLIEKRFGSEVRESLTTTIVGQAFYAATENKKIEVLGDPLFRVEIDGGVKLMDIGEALQHFKLPEQGDFTYTCEVELKPTFTLPELKGIEIKMPTVTITDELVDEQVMQHRRRRGRLEPVTDAAARDDQCVAEVVLTVGDQEVRRDENLTVGVRPTVVNGIPVVNLDEVLIGAKPGDTRTAECAIPPDFERADLRGQAGTLRFTVHEIKRLAPEALDAFLAAYGFDSEKDLRDDIRARLEGERDEMIARAKKAQIEEYLLKHTELELPQEFSARQTARAVMRHVIDMQQRGVPAADIEAQIDALRTSAKEQVASDLKLGFILEKVADELGITVVDEEVNSQIARIAQVYRRRFDRVRDELQQGGLLNQLVEQIRQDKCVERLLEDAKFVAADADQKDTAAPAKKRSRKKKAAEDAAE